MKAELIFSCWARLPGGRLEHVDLMVDGHAAAIAAGFQTFPRATAVSCRATGINGKERRYG